MHPTILCLNRGARGWQSTTHLPASVLLSTQRFPNTNTPFLTISVSWAIHHYQQQCHHYHEQYHHYDLKVSSPSQSTALFIIVITIAEKCVILMYANWSLPNMYILFKSSLLTRPSWSWPSLGKPHSWNLWRKGDGSMATRGSLKTSWESQHHRGHHCGGGFFQFFFLRERGSVQL